MSATAKNLQYYLDHPEEMPTDVKEIERLTRESHEDAMTQGQKPLDVEVFAGKPDTTDAAGGVKAEEAKDKVEAKPAAKGEEKPVVKAEAAPVEKPEEAKPEGVLAKDGKHVIPYSQLESARQRAATAEELAREQAARIAALEAKSKPVEGAQTDMLTEEELAVLEADSPTLAKTLRGQQAMIRRLSETVQGLAEQREAEVEKTEAEIATEIQSAIDANPTLAGWQTAEDQSMWDRAAKFDQVLRADPLYANKPFADRFAKVVEMTNAAVGAEESPKEETPAVVPKPEDVKAQAEAKLKAAAKAAKPTSLSQIPGGAPPAVDEKEKLEQMSPTAMGQLFLSMTPEQREAYLSNL